MNGRKYRGKTSNLSRYGYFAFLFEVNEYLPKEHKLTDFQIAKCVAKEFPEWKRGQDILRCVQGQQRSIPENSISFYRRKYNQGKLFHSCPGRNGPISYRYDSEGERVVFWHSKGKPRRLTPEDEAEILERYGPDERRKPDFSFKAKEVKPVRKPIGRPSYASFDWCI